MKVFQNKATLKEHLAELKKNDFSIGLVPTMGALHKGHTTLISRAVKECDVVVCSIYVNPHQFNNLEDLVKYPRTLENDTRILISEGCDILFCPSNEEMYSEAPVLSFNFGVLETVMEGAHRPGHFNGVGLVVSKLFNIVQPSRAYFGLKDYQQFVIVNKLVKDLSMDLKVEGVPTVREDDGLALSSRNKNLSKKERTEAVVYNKALLKGADAIRAGESFENVKMIIREMFKGRMAKLEYVEIAQSSDLSKPTKENGKPLVICIAGYVGKTRLIDNILVD